MTDTKQATARPWHFHAPSNTIRETLESGAQLAVFHCDGANRRDISRVLRAVNTFDRAREALRHALHIGRGIAMCDEHVDDEERAEWLAVEAGARAVLAEMDAAPTDDEAGGARSADTPSPAKMAQRIGPDEVVRLVARDVLKLCAVAADRDRLAREHAALREALREDPARWSFDTLALVARRLLDEVYPARIFTGVSGDPGPLFVVALRDALAAVEAAEKGA